MAYKCVLTVYAETICICPNFVYTVYILLCIFKSHDYINIIITYTLYVWKNI